MAHQQQHHQAHDHPQDQDFLDAQMDSMGKLQDHFGGGSVDVGGGIELVGIAVDNGGNDDVLGLFGCR